MARTQTVAERLDRPQQLNSTVRSYSYGEYSEKRANYVGFDKYGAGADYGNLAKALDSFYGEFRHYANDVFLPQYKERGEAIGQEDFNGHSETDGYTKNRLAFKDFVEKHPEMANSNPWVRVGYEKARLNTLALEMENGLQQAMVDNGIYNEEDESKAKLFAQNYIKHFKDEAGLSGYEDSVLLAKAFGSKEAQIYDGAIDQYNRVQNAEQQKKLANGVHDEMVTILTSTNMTDEQKNIALQEALNRGREHGLLDSNAEALVPEVIKATYAITKNESILDKCKTFEVNGRKLINWKGVPEWISAEKTRIAQKQAAEAQKAEIAYQKFMRNQVAKAATEIGMMFADGKATDRNEAIDNWCKEHKVQLDPAARYELEYKVEQQRQHIASRPESLISAQSTIDEIKATSETLGDQEKKLQEAYVANPHPEIRRALNEVRTRMGKEDANAANFEASIDKTIEGQFKQRAGQRVSKEVGIWQKQDASTNNSYSYDQTTVTLEMTSDMKAVYDDKIKEGMDTWRDAHPGKVISKAEYQDIANNARDEVFGLLDGGAFTAKRLVKDRLITPTFSDGKPKYQPFYSGMETSQIKKAEQWRKSLDSQLKMPSNKTSYKSIDSLEGICDTRKMFDSGVTEVTTDTLIKYAKPNSPYFGAGQDKSGNVVLPYRGGRTEEDIALIRLDNVDNPEVKVSTDASNRVKILDNPKAKLERKERILVGEVLAKEYNVDTTVFWDLRTQSDIVTGLKKLGWKDEQIIDFWSTLQKRITAEKAPKKPKRG